MIRIIALSILLALASCGSSLDEKTEALVHAKDLWLSQVGTGDYSFDLQKRCFCANDGQVIRLLVEGGVIAHVQITRDSTSGGTEDSAFRPTMLDMFELVLELTQQETESEGTLEVEYDHELGHPTKISWAGEGADDYLVLTISDVVAD